MLLSFIYPLKTQTSSEAEKNFVLDSGRNARFGSANHYVNTCFWRSHQQQEVDRVINAAAESFNAKIKAFRNAMRGVRDVEFFLFRLSKIYA